MPPTGQQLSINIVNTQKVYEPADSSEESASPIIVSSDRHQGA